VWDPNFELAMSALGGKRTLHAAARNE